MKLAEAMKEKSRLKKKITGLREELERAAEGKEGSDTNPKDLLMDLEESLRRLDRLTAAIYRTCSQVRDEGKTLTQLICTRDTLFFRQELYKKLLRLAEGAENPSPAGPDLSGLRDKAQRTKEEIRSLNDRIQKAGWTSELIE